MPPGNFVPRFIDPPLSENDSDEGEDNDNDGNDGNNGNQDFESSMTSSATNMSTNDELEPVVISSDEDED